MKFFNKNFINIVLEIYQVLFSSYNNHSLFGIPFSKDLFLKFLLNNKHSWNGVISII